MEEGKLKELALHGDTKPPGKEISIGQTQSLE